VNTATISVHLRYGDSDDAADAVRKLHDDLITPAAPAHSCDAELRASPAFQPNHCEDGALWTCSCGKVYEHVCDEAEGCLWHEVDA